jgi:membrane associated rhomboid family serine protease
MICKKFSVTLILVGSLFGQAFGAEMQAPRESVHGAELRQPRGAQEQQSSWGQRVREACTRSCSSLRNTCKKYPVTVGLVAANIGIFAAQKCCQFKTKSPVLEMKFGQLNSAVKHGEWWRLCTNLFLHPNLLQLVLSTYGLLGLRQLEQTFGSKKFLGIYMISGVLANVASYTFGKPEELCVGQGGGISGLGAASWGREIRNRRATHGDFAVKGVAAPMLFGAVGQAIGLGRCDHAAFLGGTASGYALGRVFSD